MELIIPDIFLASIQYGFYISPFKLLIFALFFIGTVFVAKWLYNDASSIDFSPVIWTNLFMAAAGIGMLLWILIPSFSAGLLIFLLLPGGAAAAYIIKRNSMVVEEDKVLTPSQIAGLLAGGKKKGPANKNFVLVTANGNDIPEPGHKSPDFAGYGAARDLITDAVWRRAENITLLPTSGDYNVTYSIDGISVSQDPLPRERAEGFISFIKDVADLNVNERRKPKKSSFAIKQYGEKIEWKINTAGSTAGEQVKIKKAEKDIIELDKIGFSNEICEQLCGIREKSQGLILITGPKKSGVTTTLYALLKNHDAFLNSIHTLEKDMAAEVPNITQEIYTQSDTGTMSFAEKLERMSRMGPDIIGISGSEDRETARTACSSALDGKIIYMTIEASNTAKAFAKWLKITGDINLASKPLFAILNQRLMRKLCDDCKQAYEPNSETLRKFNLSPEKAKILYRPGKVQYDKHGKPSPCDTCQETGYVGQTAVFETIVFDEKLRNEIKKAKTVSDVSGLFRKHNMLYLQEQALKKVIEGTTSVNEVIRVLSTEKNKKKKKQ